MLSFNYKDILSATIEQFMIPAERVAHVQVSNSLEHGLLLLTKSGYTALPVLDPHYKLYGLISLPMIFDSILGLQRIEFEKLDELKVSEVMNENIPRLRMYDSVQLGLDMLIDHPFVCVVNDEGIFEGIITRRAILLKVQELSNQYKD